MQRWLVFPVSRDALAKYLDGDVTLRSILEASDLMYSLESRTRLSELDERKLSRRAAVPKRYLTRIADKGVIAEYLPAEDSFFDVSLTDDLDLTQQIVPKPYNVPIKGTWFDSDFENLFKRYKRLYAFFYSTRPSFVKTVSARLGVLLRSPWRGGASRVNLFTQLSRDVPAIHGLRVAGIAYNSPGDIRFEAIQSIGESIQSTIALYISKEFHIDESVKKINKILKDNDLRKKDTSKMSNEAVPVERSVLIELQTECDTISEWLKIQPEISSLSQHSPNVVVTSKAVSSFMRNLDKLARYERLQMLAFTSED